MQRQIPSRRGIRLREVLPKARFCGAEDIFVESCSSDARQCRPGDLFVALVGTDEDGHDQTSIAVRRGAAAVVAERLVSGVPTCLVPDSREAFGHICHSLAGKPSEQLKVLGVSGTSGKTTTCHLTAAVLKAGGVTVGVSSSLGRTGMDSEAAPAHSTPPPAEMARWLAEINADGASFAVVEASSQGLAERRLAGLELDAAMITNLRCDHLDFHGNVRNYRRAKQRLFEHLKSDGFAVLNADDAGCQQLLPKLTCPVITIGRREPAEVMAQILERHRSEQTFLLTAGNETVPVRTRMIGYHHIDNCLAATAVGLVLGIPLTTIVRGLESIDRIPGCLDRIECGQPFGVYVDTASTPDQLTVALRTLRSVTPGRLICVFGDDAGNPADRPMLGRVLERASDLGIITTCCDQADHTFDVIHDVLDGYDRPSRAHVMPSRSQAITWALAEANEDDTILIAGGDHCQMAEPTLGSLDADHAIARQWLYESAVDEPVILPFTA